MTTADRPAPLARQRRWWWRMRLSVGGAMLLVAALAVGLAYWDRICWIRVEIHNESDWSISRARVGQSTIVAATDNGTELGPIARHSRASCRLPRSHGPYFSIITSDGVEIHLTVAEPSWRFWQRDTVRLWVRDFRQPDPVDLENPGGEVDYFSLRRWCPGYGIGSPIGGKVRYW